MTSVQDSHRVVSKRIIDLFVSAIALLILSPILILLFLLVWIFLGWPVHLQPGAPRAARPHLQTLQVPLHA